MPEWAQEGGPRATMDHLLWVFTMGGEVAVAIRRKGRVSTRVLYKARACELTSSRLFKMAGPVFDEWKSEPAAPMAPDNYGLVVIDYDQKWAGSIQGYTNTDARFVQMDDQEDRDDLRALWDEGRVLGLTEKQYQNSEFKNGFDAFVEKYNQLNPKEKWHSLQFYIAPPKGWEIERFDEDDQGWTKMVHKLLNLGFKFSDRDLAAWDSYFGDYERDLQVGVLRAHWEANKIEKSTMKAPSKRGPARRI